MTKLHDLIFDALSRRGCGPALVRVGLHADDLADLMRDNPPQLQLHAEGRRIYGFLVAEDAFAPRGAPVIRDTLWGAS